MTDRWIVVGAGSAGCVAAARLSGHGPRDVTLIESGPHLLPGQVPGGISGSNFLAALATPGRTHEALTARRTSDAEPATYQRGRGVGGSSAVNAMVALRGDPRVYLPPAWGDVDSLWDDIALSTERPSDDELGAVDHALLAADPRAEVAELTRRSGRRITSAEAYLWPVLDRPNLSLRVESDVDRVLFDGRRAIGVRLVDGTEIEADRVVLAAGAIHTPAILLRSGVDTSGVGANLQDHPSAPFTLQLRAGVAHDVAGLAIGSLLTDDDIQLLPMNHLGAGDAEQGLGLLMAALMKPLGRNGRVSLAVDPEQHEPDVDFALLTDDRDVDALLRGVRLARSILQHAAFQEIVDDVFIDAFGSRLSHLVDDTSIATWLRSNCGDYVHAAGTCAMGTVVDADGCVFGYESLSVCDASVFPVIPDVNTHLPTTMLAERLCDRWTSNDSTGTTGME